MEYLIRTAILLLAAILIVYPLSAQKKAQSFTLSKVLNVPADEVWKAIALDYGAVSRSHPKVIESEYINNSLKGEVGAERICYFNTKKSKYLKERITDFNDQEMVMTNAVFKAGKFPLDEENTRAVYSVEDLGNGKSRIGFDMRFRTKPAFMGFMAKGKFKKLIKDYFIAIEHHIKTGENVNANNFKSIKKNYSS